MKLYCDIDGVLNPFPNMGKMGDFDDFENHDIIFAPDQKLLVRLSKKMVSELKALDVEIVFNTTWCDYSQALEELSSIVGLEGTRQLHYDDISGAAWRHYRHQKALKLVDDVKKHGEPFLWVDDEAIDVDGANFVRMNTDVPHKFIVPNHKTGITMSDIEDMKAFVTVNS